MAHRRNNPDEIQLRIDPMHADLDEGITGLRSQVRRLRDVPPSSLDSRFNLFLKQVPVFIQDQVAQVIHTESRINNDLVSQLDMTVMKAQAWLKNNVRRLNKSTIQNGSNHIVHVVCFGLVIFFLVYFWSKISR